MKGRFALVVMLALTHMTTSPRGTGAQKAPDLVAQARVFMQDYERDLSAFDVDAIVARYDPRGAVVMVDGQGGARTSAEIGKVYRSVAKGPSRFAWKDLVFEQVAPDAIMVRGGFSYQLSASSPEMLFTYLAVLLGGRDGLYIVLEREAPVRGSR
jgi:hypothetical protein